LVISLHSFQFFYFTQFVQKEGQSKENANVTKHRTASIDPDCSCLDFSFHIFKTENGFQAILTAMITICGWFG
jgi:hypothetical protein